MIILITLMTRCRSSDLNFHTLGKADYDIIFIPLYRLQDKIAGWKMYQNSTDVYDNFSLKWVTGVNWGVSDLWYPYSNESSQLGCWQLVTVIDINHQLQQPSVAFTGEFWRLSLPPLGSIYAVHLDNCTDAKWCIVFQISQDVFAKRPLKTCVIGVHAPWGGGGDVGFMKGTWEQAGYDLIHVEGGTYNSHLLCLKLGADILSVSPLFADVMLCNSFIMPQYLIKYICVCTFFCVFVQT